MPKETPQPEGDFGKDIHQVVLGAPFKPYERAIGYYQPPKEGEFFKVPENYDRYIYLRRRIALYGINGFIDVISDHPMSIVHRWSVMGRGYRFFQDQPFGYFFPEYKRTKEGSLEPVKDAAILRFSFLVNNPAEYVKLLNTYGDAEIGEDKFFLPFNINELTIKQRLKLLEEGKKLVIPEKNLFNYKELERMAEEAAAKGMDLNAEQPEAPRGDPGRISFVTFPPEEIEKVKTIQVTFHRYGHDGEREYPIEPVQPNLQPLPILV